MSNKRDLLVLGVGNLILGDEGIGVHTIQQLEKMKLPDYVDIMDGGTAGLGLMGPLQEYKHVLIIDAAVDKNPIGTIRHIFPKFTADYPPQITIHEIGLKDVIDAMKIDGYCPEIEMIAISVEKYDTICLDLTPKVKDAMNKVVEMVMKLVQTQKYGTNLCAAN